MVRISRVTAALALITTGTAHAADMPGLPPPIPVQPVAPVTWLTSGWYLRGDLGYHLGTVGGAEAQPPFPNPRDSKSSNAFVGSIGAGIKTSWLRTDFTLDYVSPVKYTGTVFTNGDTTAHIQTNAALFNGYFDLGTWYRLTPYVGAGAGVAYVRVSDYQGPAPPVTNGDSSQWKFAWAAMAGVGWRFAPNMTADFGYRYLNVGDVKTADAAGSMTFKNVAGHEIRIGLRWNFDDYRDR